MFESMLSKSLESAETQVNQLTRDDEPDDKAYTQLDQAIKEIQSLKKSYMMEMSQVTSVEQIAPLRELLEKYDQRLGKLQRTYQAEKAQHERNQLLPLDANGKQLGRCSIDHNSAHSTFQIQKILKICCTQHEICKIKRLLHCIKVAQ